MACGNAKSIRTSRGATAWIGDEEGFPAGSRRDGWAVSAVGVLAEWLHQSGASLHHALHHARRVPAARSALRLCCARPPCSRSKFHDSTPARPARSRSPRAPPEALGHVLAGADAAAIGVSTLRHDGAGGRDACTAAGTDPQARVHPRPAGCAACLGRRAAVSGRSGQRAARAAGARGAGRAGRAGLVERRDAGRREPARRCWRVRRRAGSARPPCATRWHARSPTSTSANGSTAPRAC